MTRRWFKKVRRWPRLARWTIGIFLVILGIIGLIVPIMPGWVFLVPGVILILGEESGLSRWIILGAHRLRRELHRRKRERLKNRK